MKTLKCDMSLAGIRNLIDYLKDYANDLPDKMYILADRLYNEVGIPTIDDLIDAADGDSDKSHATAFVIRHEADGISGTLVVSGQDIVFIEFGAGAHYNTPAGSSPHPKGEQFGYTIGSYGQGKGAFDSWWYYDNSGNLVRSLGTEATMPLLNANKEMAEAAVRICKEVFA